MVGISRGASRGVLIKNSEALEHLQSIRYFMTDKTKISDRIGVRLCDFSELTGVISDIRFPKETLERYPNVRFITAEDDGE